MTKLHHCLHFSTFFRVVAQFGFQFGPVAKAEMQYKCESKKKNVEISKALLKVIVWGLCHG